MKTVSLKMKIFCWLLFCLLPSLLFGQNVSCPIQADWTIFPATIKGSSSGECITHDSLGNIYVAGEFEKELLIGKQQLISHGKTDIFIAKYNPKGEVLWVQSAGGKGNDLIYWLNIVNDTLLLAGSFDKVMYLSNKVLKWKNDPELSGFFATFDFQGKLLKITVGLKTLYLFALNQTFIFALHGITGYDEIPHADSLKKHSIAFNFYHLSSDSLPEDTRYILFHSNRSLDTNIIDTLKWYTFIETKDKIFVSKIIETKEFDYHYAGTFTGTLKIGDLILTSSGRSDGFILRLDEDGKITHAEAIGGMYDDEINAVTVTPTGEIYVTGSMQGSGYKRPDYFLRKYRCVK